MGTPTLKWHIVREILDSTQRCDLLVALVSLMVALVTILLNNKVSGEGPEGIEGLLSRGVRWGQKGKSLFSLETRKDPSLQSEHKKHKKKKY